MSEKFEVTNLNMKSGMSLKIKGKIHNDVNSSPLPSKTKTSR
ncbi:lectin, galactoside-binding, soluble 2, isoform CRA_b [Rattus norvegicus]|uniref:Lectin, galactoside-binding, soluble 2, isoform CRA_b n=1 Tax=Rattus norvegicus TaxID=10116 RepID=A6HSM6_RAT|nr:lectin, galactoside-binding, soluble 2, isoform CRA_b [Rattus norvegicus]